MPKVASVLQTGLFNISTSALILVPIFAIVRNRYSNKMVYFQISTTTETSAFLTIRSSGTR